LEDRNGGTKSISNRRLEIEAPNSNFGVGRKFSGLNLQRHLQWASNLWPVKMRGLLLVPSLLPPCDALAPDHPSHCTICHYRRHQLSKGQACWGWPLLDRPGRSSSWRNSMGPPRQPLVTLVPSRSSSPSSRQVACAGRKTLQ
jgi:hypothetical protein